MKRKLNEDEQRLTERGLERLQEEEEQYGYLIESCDLLLQKGLYIKYKKDVEMHKKQRADATQQLEMIHKNIEILEDQLANGVEVKQSGNRKNRK